MSDTLIVGATGMVGQAVLANASEPLTVLARRDVPGLPPQHRLTVAPSEAWPGTIHGPNPAPLDP
ncbi:MAG: NAD-dependent dehydratase, partial [Sphingopyxis sp.]|nr:NAD-dependent dehydratase [Sphingopyxis sp.]